MSTNLTRAGSGGSSSSGWTDDGTVVRLTTITDQVLIGALTTSITDAQFVIEANNTLMKMHDLSNDATAQLKNSGGEFDIGIFDDNVPSIISTINMNVGGEMELSVAGATTSGRFVFYLENDPKVILANDGSLNALYNLTAKGTNVVSGTGTVTSSGTILSGIGTAFLTQLHVGDYLNVPDEGSLATVVSITDNTTLITDVELTSYGESFTYQRPTLEVNRLDGTSRFFVNPTSQAVFTGVDGVTNLVVKGGGGGSSFFGDNGQIVMEDLDGNHVATFGDAFWITKRYGIMTLGGDSSDTGAGYTRIFEIDGIDRYITTLGGPDKRCFTWQVAQIDGVTGDYYFSMFTRVNSRVDAVSGYVVPLGTSTNGNVLINGYIFDYGLDIAGAASTDRLQVKGDSYLGGDCAIKGKVTKYNNIATAGWGQPAIYGSGRATAQTAANTSVSTYTVGVADGSFIVSCNVLVTTSTAHSFTVTCTYTDEGNTSRTVTFNVQQLGGTLVTSITNITGAGPYEGVPLHIRAKASTAITIKTAGTFTTVTYNVEGVITQIS